MNRTQSFPQSLLFSVILLCLITMLGAGSALAADKLSYRLKWLRNVSVIGSLWAESTGMFSTVGLDVEVKPGGPERDAIRELELGHADFGVASADQVLRARAKGSPVVVIAQLFQVNPLQWIYRPDEVKINTLADLRDKVLGVTFGGNDESIMRTLLAEGGLEESDVKLFSVRYDYTPFYRRQVQLWPVYRNAQGPIIAGKLEVEGEQTAFFNPADFGVKFVANCVVTHAKTLQEKPEMVKQFLTALLSGWNEALKPENEQKALDILQKYDPDTTRMIQEKQLWMTRPLIQPEPTFAIGTIDEDGWVQTQKIMINQKLLEAEVDLKEVLKPVPVNYLSGKE